MLGFPERRHKTSAGSTHIFAKKYPRCLKLRVDSNQTSLPACGKTIPAIYNSGSGLPHAAPS
jgi:hypothetical protein